jgi:hypothetical protein
VPFANAASGWLAARTALVRRLHPRHGVYRESEAIARKQTFLLIRYIMILATGALAFFETTAGTSPLPLVVLVGTALLSNVVLGQASPFSFFDALMQAPILVSDTAMISIALLLSRASQEFFFFFFFVLIMAAKLENLVTLGIGAALIGVASFLMADASAGWAAPVLMRIPFLFAAGVFFGYVVLPERTGHMAPINRSTPRPRTGPTIRSTKLVEA